MKLQLDCLLNMSKISKILKDNQEREENEQILTIYERAYNVKYLLIIYIELIN